METGFAAEDPWQGGARQGPGARLPEAMDLEVDMVCPIDCRSCAVSSWEVVSDGVGLSGFPFPAWNSAGPGEGATLR